MRRAPDPARPSRPAKRPHPASGRWRGPGFTLIELVTVLLIASILAVFFLPRLLDWRAFSARGYYDEVVAALRYAQKTAVASNCPVQVRLTADGFALDQPPAVCRTGAGFSDPVLRPRDEAPYRGRAPAGVRLRPAPLSFEFTPLGGTTLARDTTLSIGSHKFTILAASGAVQ